MKLLSETRSICPEDLKVIDAQLWEIDGQVIMKKSCPEHGNYEDIIWSEYDQYLKAGKYLDDGRCVGQPLESKLGCPLDCGICFNHKSHTTLLIMDLTNRCNLKCPVCFSAALADEYLYEPTKDQIRQILEYTQEVNHPVRVNGVQHSGGEPTLREDLLDIIAMERELGYDYTLLATNGIRFAEDIDYFKKFCDLNVYLYLQFDGMSAEPYMHIRGRDLWPVKQKVLENARKIGFKKVVLVPTLVKSINDHQVGDMVRFAAENSDIVKHLVFQPASFSGRIELQDLRNKRITVSDITRLCEEQTGGELLRSDFYSLPMNNTLGKMITKLSPTRVDAAPHPHCGVITMVSVEKGKLKPIVRHVKNDLFYDHMKTVLAKHTGRLRLQYELALGFLKYVSPRLWLKFLPVIAAKNYKAYRHMTEDWMPNNWLTISTMHFMDPYNFDVDRAHHCCLHYGVLDKQTKARLIPFCAMNSIHREAIEREFSVPHKKKESLAAGAPEPARSS